MTEETEPASRQFTLRSLLVLTTVAAVLAAIGSLAGRGWALALIGVFLALANYLGMLAVVQRPRFAQVVLYLAMVPFVASFFLPVLVWPLTTQTQVAGWELCFAYVTSYRSFFQTGLASALAGIVILYVAVLGNIAMAALPLMAHRIVVEKARWYMAVLTVGAGISWITFVFYPGQGFGYGYFVWCGALTVPLVVVRLPRGRLIALLVMLLAATVFMWWENYP